MLNDGGVDMLQTTKFEKVVGSLEKVLKTTRGKFGVAQPLFESIGTVSLMK